MRGDVDSGNEFGSLTTGMWYAWAMDVAPRTAPYAVSMVLAGLALLWSMFSMPAAYAEAGYSVDARSRRVAQGPTTGKTSAPRVGAEVDRVRVQLAASRRELSRLRAVKAALDKEYQGRLAEIDRLKQQRASWRRDRAIRARMGESHGTASQLADLDQAIRRQESVIRKQRQTLVTAISRELARAPTATRRAQLLGWQKEAKHGLRREAKKIILPEETIDPLADPEELEYQASLLRQSERELARELARLDQQAKHYRRMAVLRQKYQRADEFARFDDDRPRRASGSSATRTQEGEADNASEPPQNAPPPDGQNTPTGGDDLGGALGEDPMFDVVLADVVDATTIRALQAAELSSDPSIKAKAAEAAREQVKKRLKQLEKRRQEMQDRARTLQGAP